MDAWSVVAESSFKAKSPAWMRVNRGLNIIMTIVRAMSTVGAINKLLARLKLSGMACSIPFRSILLS